jgi:pimeloyl-ACP methyl ester carboxylesterase
MTPLPTFTSLGAGTTILMLHGIDGGHRAFAPQVERFAGAGYRAVSWDMPGYGHSAPIEAYTFKGLAESCIRLIDGLLDGDAAAALERGTTAATPRSVMLLGHGFGGMVAQEVVARRPDLVRALVLCGSTARFDADANGSAAQQWRHAFVAQREAEIDAGRGMAEIAQTLVPRMIGPASLPEGVALAVHCMAQIPQSTYRRALQALPTFDREADLSRIHVPTLLVAGEFDKSAPPDEMERMSKAIGGSSFAQMKGIGALQNLEAPDEFDELVLNFLARPRWLH